MQENNIIQCYPRAPIWQWPLAIFGAITVFGGFIAMVLSVVADVITGDETTQHTKYILFAVGSVLGIVLMLVFQRWVDDRWYWVLEEDRLIGGKKKDKVFPLSSISAIVAALPDKMHPLIAANKSLSVNNKLTYERLSDTVHGHERNQIMDGVGRDVGQG